MAIITITSDWNQDDYYLAAVKGCILNQCPEVHIVEISNQAPPFNLSLAAFRLKNSYKHFPPGTVHIFAVNSETGEGRSWVALKAEGHYFIGNNNGVFGLILDKDPDETVELESTGTDTFPELNVFAKAACRIVTEGGITALGTNSVTLYKQIPMLPAIEESVINGSVVYIDSYKNAITNISRELFEQIGKGRTFEILVQSNHYRIKRLNSRYGDSSPGEMLALFNSLGLLEIAINMGNAADLLNLALNSSIRVKFK